MSGCANPNCKGYGSHHDGVGQSPEHPVDINPWIPIGIILLVIVGVIIITLVQP